METKTITIEQVYKKQTQTKYGLKNKLGFKSEGIWYNAFENATCKHWKEGDSVTINYEVSEYQGKPQYNIKFDRPSGVDNAKIDKVVSELAELKAMVTEIYKSICVESGVVADKVYDPDDPQDVPF